MTEIFADGVNSIAISNGVARLELVQLRRNAVGETKLVPQTVGTLFLPLAGLQQMLQQLTETARRVQDQKTARAEDSKSETETQEADEALTNL
jgi:hypothetical protein